MKGIVSSLFTLSMLAVVLGFASSYVAAQFNPVTRLNAPSASPYGSIVGRVEIVPGIAATSDFVPRVTAAGDPTGFRVIVEGLPNGVLCDAYGGFRLDRVPLGVRTLIVVPPNYDIPRDGPQPLPVRKLVGVTSNGIYNAGTIVVTKPGSITGRITLIDSPTVDMADLVVAIPQFGLVTKVNPDGGYLLTGVPPGTWNARLMGPGIRESRETVRLTYVAAMNPSVGVNFTIRGQNVPAASQVDPSIVPPNTPVVQGIDKDKPMQDQKESDKAPDKPVDQKTPAEIEKEKAIKELLNKIPIKKP